MAEIRSARQLKHYDPTRHDTWQRPPPDRRLDGDLEVRGPDRVQFKFDATGAQARAILTLLATLEALPVGGLANHAKCHSPRLYFRGGVRFAIDRCYHDVSIESCQQSTPKEKRRWLPR